MPPVAHVRMRRLSVLPLQRGVAAHVPYLGVGAEDVFQNRTDDPVAVDVFVE